MHRSFVLFLLVALVSSPLTAQTFSVGQETNGQINVQVNATLGDGGNDYNPVTGLGLTLYRGATDSLSLRTDDAGVLKFAIAPGTYRLASAAPYNFRGRSYRWNIPLVVAPGIRIVNLTSDNATIAGPALASASGARAAAGDPAPAPPGYYERKSGTVGVLLSVLVTGGGQMYAGKVNKGLGLLALGVVGGGVAVVSATQVDKQVANEGVWQTLGIAGVVTSVGSYIYSIATANGDVTEFNRARHPIVDASPAIQQRDGRTSVGLALRF